MIPDEHLDNVLREIRRGSYSLLLGSGFSASSQSSDGRSLPTARQLTEELAALRGLPNTYSLGQIAGMFDPDELNKYFQRRFGGCTASARSRLLSSFVWKRIFTENIDDVLLDCYAPAESLQQLEIYTINDRFAEPSDRAVLPVVHLHGYVGAAEQGYVFSPADYGRIARQDHTWLSVLTDELGLAPFIIVGFGFQEPDLEAYLATRRAARAQESLLAPSLFVTRKLDPVLKHNCDRFGLVPIEADSDDFWGYLDDIAGLRPSPIQLAVPTSAAFASTADARSLRIFFRQWVFIAESELPIPLSKPRHLLEGVEPAWPHLLNREDVLRRDSSELAQEVLTWLETGSAKPALRILRAAAGEGKSVVLKRLGLQLAERAVTTLCFESAERLKIDAALDVIRAADRPLVLLFDGLPDNYGPLREVLDALDSGQMPVFVVCAIRSTEYADVRYRLGPLLDGPDVLRELKYLDKGEAATLVEKLRENGLLGENAGRPNGDIANDVEGSQMLAAISEARASADLFKGLIRIEYEGLSERAQEIYLATAIAHSLGHHLRVALLPAITGSPAHVGVSIIRHELPGVVRFVDSMGEYIGTRHRIVARALVMQLAPQELFQAFVAVADAIGPYVSPKTIHEGTHEAILARSLMDYDDVVAKYLPGLEERYFAALEPAHGWSSRYWAQRAALAQASRDGARAKTFSDQAVGLENHPVTRSTRAKVYFWLAVEYARPSDKAEFIASARRDIDLALTLSRARHRKDSYAVMIGVQGVAQVLRDERRTNTLDDDFLDDLWDWGQGLLHDNQDLLDRETFFQLRARLREFADKS